MKRRLNGLLTAFCRKQSSTALRRAFKGGIFGLAVFGIGALGVSMPVHAEKVEGNPDWYVSFTGSGMDSNFQAADINDAIYSLQPGDSIDITLTLKNEGGRAADWWMSNQVIKSLEDSQESAASGGYTYTLIYQYPNGEQEILYSSETVGGEPENTDKLEGLHEATDALSKLFYLDTLYGGQQGRIFLTVSLDGETQGNGYQDTLAQLNMQFAVEELDDTTPPDPGDEEPPETPDSPNDKRTPPKTGDETNLMTYVTVSLVSGICLLILALLSLRRTGKREEEEQ